MNKYADARAHSQTYFAIRKQTILSCLKLIKNSTFKPPETSETKSAVSKIHTVCKRFNENNAVKNFFTRRKV